MNVVNKPLMFDKFLDTAHFNRVYDKLILNFSLLMNSRNNLTENLKDYQDIFINISSRDDLVLNDKNKRNSMRALKNHSLNYLNLEKSNNFKDDLLLNTLAALYLLLEEKGYGFERSGKYDPMGYCSTLMKKSSFLKEKKFLKVCE